MDFSNILELLKHADPRQLGENLFMLFAARFFLMPVVNSQLEKIQVQVGNLADSFNRMQATLTQIETNHSLRLAKLEDEMKGLQNPTKGES